MPFYVYIFRDALGRIVYIGKGTGKRFQDQRRRLNRRAYVTGEIAWCTNNEDKAYRAERLLIFRHQPLWNKRRGGVGGRKGMCLDTRIQAARALARKGKAALLQYMTVDKVDAIFAIARCRSKSELPHASTR